MSDVRYSIRSQIEQLQNLPPLPDVARRVLELRSHPRPDATALAAIIDLDPSLSAQVIRYARSSLYGYRGNVENVESAIARVLGYDTVLNLALGLATSTPFQIPRSGPLGSESYWQNAVRTAVISQKLGAQIAKQTRIIPGMAYLGGLLHDFGLLVVGHLFPDYYETLNNELIQHPDLDLAQRENELMGVTHAEAGARALRFWDLPDELVVAALKHLDGAYQGLHQEYANLIHVAATLAASTPETLKTNLERASAEPCFAALKLDAAQVEAILAPIVEGGENFEGILRQVAA